MIENMQDPPIQPVAVQGTYLLTEKDLYEAQLRHKGWLATAIRIVGFILVAVGTVSIVHRDWTGLFVFIWGLFLLFQLRLSMKNSFKKNFAGQSETTMSASDSGLDFINSKLDSSLKWSAYVAYAESANLFLLYTQANIFNLIPKRALTADGVDDFRALLQRHVPLKRMGRTATITLVLTIAIVVITIPLIVWIAYKGAH